eukprot:COSAG05_NODE_12179_length_479_cov_2.284211_1_plen_148_part_10
MLGRFKLDLLGLSCSSAAAGRPPAARPPASLTWPSAGFAFAPHGATVYYLGSGPMEGWGGPAYVAAAAAAVVGTLVVAAARLGSAIYLSIEPLPPTAAQLKEENLEAHALFRHFAQLKRRVAWRQIGSYPTPVHTVRAMTPDGANIEF